MYYSPICFYHVAQRSGSPPSASGSTYSPIIWEQEMLSQTPIGGIAWFDACGHPVATSQDAYYAVYPDFAPPPPGFHLIFPAQEQSIQSWSTGVQTQSELL